MLVTLDGKDIDEPLIRPPELYDPKGHTSSGPVHQSGSTWKLRKYRFGCIRIGKQEVRMRPMAYTDFSQRRATEAQSQKS